MRLARTSWLVFDLDDTLANTQQYSIPPFWAAMRQVLAESNIPHPQEADAFHRHFRETYLQTGCGPTTLAQQHGLDRAWVESIYQRAAGPGLEAVVKNLQPSPRVKQHLQTLKNHGHHLHILTLGHAEYALPVLEHLGLLHSIFPPENVHTRAFKREETPYQTLLQKFPHLSPLPRYMVEDSPANLAPAKQLGFTTIGVGRHTEKKPFVDHWFPTIDDLLEAVV